MKILLIALPVMLVATSVNAIPKYTSTRISCERVQATIRQHGAVILTYPSLRQRGQMLYDTYVANRRFCRPGEIVARVTVPSADRPYCPVSTCKPEDRSGRDMGRDRGPNDPTRP